MLNIKNIVERYWYIQGAAAALAITSAIPNVSNFGRYEFLLSINAVVQSWTSVTLRIADGTSNELLMGLSAFDINSIAFLIFFSIPAAIGFRRFDENYFNLNYINPFFRFISVSISALIFQVVFMTFLSPDVQNSFESNIIAIFLICLIFLIGLATLKRFAKTLVFCLIFVVTLQILYYANAPWVRDYVLAWSCEKTACD